MSGWRKITALAVAILLFVALAADRISSIVDLPENLRTVSRVVDVIFDMTPGATVYLIAMLVALAAATSNWWIDPAKRLLGDARGLINEAQGQTAGVGLGRGMPKYLPIYNAAQRCFDETGLYADFDFSGEQRLLQFVIFMVIEAKENPNRLSLWGVQVPGAKLQRIPPSEINWIDMHPDGKAIYREDHHGRRVEWHTISVPVAELPEFIERLKTVKTAGQQPMERHPEPRNIPQS